MNNKEREFLNRFEKNLTMPDISDLSNEEIDTLLTALSEGDTITDEEKAKIDKKIELERKFNILSSAVSKATDEEFEYLEKVADELIKYMMNNEKVKKDFEYKDFLRNSIYSDSNYSNDNTNHSILKRTK